MENFIFCAVIHCFEREKSKIFESLNVTEAENRRKAGNLLYYHQISMKYLHQFDLLYSILRKFKLCMQCRKNYNFFSPSKLQKDSGLMQSLKLRLNLCLFKLLSPKCS